MQPFAPLTAQLHVGLASGKKVDYGSMYSFSPDSRSSSMSSYSNCAVVSSSTPRSARYPTITNQPSVFHPSNPVCALTPTSPESSLNRKPFPQCRHCRSCVVASRPLRSTVPHKQRMYQQKPPPVRRDPKGRWTWRRLRHHLRPGSLYESMTV